MENDVKLMTRTRGSSKRIDSTNKPEDDIYIRTKLDGESAKQFKNIQEENNFVTYAETLRYIVNQSYKAAFLELNDDLHQEIQRLINNKSIRVKHSFKDLDDFSQRAITFYVNNIKEEVATLADWEFRSTLSPDQRQVAIALLKIQIDEKKLTGVLVEDLVLETEFTSKKLEKILNYFIDQDLVIKTTLKNRDYYSAIILG